MGRKKSSPSKTADSGTLKAIADTMSGVEWDSQVGNQIADLLHTAGYEIADPDPARLPPATCPKCGKRDELCVTETYTAYHPYNAQRHTAENALGYGTDELDDGASDYAGLCRACGHTGTLDEFGMKLLDWTDLDDDCDHVETSDTPDFGSSKTCDDCGYYFTDEGD